MDKTNLFFNKLLAISLCLLLTVGFVVASLFIIPPKYAHAATTTVDAYSPAGCFDIVHTNDTPSSLDEMTLVAQTASNSFYFSGSTGVYGALYTYQVFGSDKIGIVFAINSDLYTGSEKIWYYFPGVSNSMLYWNLSSGTSNSTYGLQYYKYEGNFDPSSYSFVTDNKVYNSLESALNALSSYEPTPTYTANVLSVYPGNICYIRYNDGLTFRATSIFREWSKSSSPYWEDSRAYILDAGSYPTSNAAIVLDTNDMIRFDMHPYGSVTNIWGRYKNGEQYFSLEGSGYMAIFVPDYMYFSGATDPDDPALEDGDVSPVLYLHNVDGIVDFRVYPTSSVLSYDEETKTFGFTSNASGSVYTNGLVNDEGDTSYTDQNGNPTTNPIGPDFSSSAEDEERGLIAQLKKILSAFASNIEQLVVAPFEILGSLTQNLSQFFVDLSVLWSWMPPELSAFITSALMLCVVIGVVRWLK